jgi:hypothetical protein
MPSEYRNAVNAATSPIMAAIQALVPAGLAAVNERLQKDLLALAGRKHQRDGVG